MKISKTSLAILVLPVLLTILTLVTSPWLFISNRETILSLILAFWMVLWWVGAVAPLGVTALIPLIYLPLLSVFPIKQVAPAYSNPIIFLFLGGFMIARGLEKTKLDERIALRILQVTGKSDRGILLGFIIATSLLSMWISNTATTVMMVPIALSVILFLEKNLGQKNIAAIPTFSTVLFLSIAYSANIGGIMTPIGTPPNVVFMGYLEDLYSRTIDFYLWMGAAVPVAVGILATMFFLLCRLFIFSFELPKGFSSFLNEKVKQLGPIDKPQTLTIWIFCIAAFLWMFKGLIHYLSGMNFLNDTSIALGAGALLFLIPVQKNENTSPILNTKDLNTLPWDIILLFGGGMALATALKNVGLIETVTQSLGALEFANFYWLIFIIAGMALFLTEIMSNVALCVVALPIIMKLGESKGIDPIAIALPAALCTSFAFSMPISTPPNAIVFGTERIKVSEMMRAGVLLNIFALIVTMSLGYFLIDLIIVGSLKS